MTSAVSIVYGYFVCVGVAGIMTRAATVDKTSLRVLTTGHLVAAIECQSDNSNCYKYLKVAYAQPPIG